MRPRRVGWHRIDLLVVVSLWTALAGSPAAAGQEVRVTNTARYLGSGRYDWSVFLVADAAVLRRIAYVEYTLHPTFPNPVRRVANSRGGFALTSNGWGEFNIPVKIVFKDRRTLNLQHWLTLQDRPRVATAATQKQREVRTGNVARRVENDRWDWEVFLEADAATLNEVRCVEYTLHPTFPEPVRSVCVRGSDPKKAFVLKSNGWGTFTIGVKVTFRDGAVQYLKHELTFGSPGSGG